MAVGAFEGELKEGGRRKREEGRRKREEGRGKKEEGRRKREEGRGKKEEGRGKKEEGRGKKRKEHLFSISNFQFPISNFQLQLENIFFSDAPIARKTLQINVTIVADKGFGWQNFYGVRSLNFPANILKPRTGTFGSYHLISAGFDRKSDNFRSHIAPPNNYRQLQQTFVNKHHSFETQLPFINERIIPNPDCRCLWVRLKSGAFRTQTVAVQPNNRIVHKLGIVDC
ncbi:hypothetical protein [Microcoleus sp. D2_18a_B4]|uniref:hypothetical protein n=1 Tax=Microcoleus sp. D2_18a_B4 TaxID=3055329 RepID=UPI002FD57D38